MNAWAIKRFWKKAVAIETDGGFSVELDGRSVKTPSKANLVVPTLALAEAIAAEWDAQEDSVDPEKMPVTRAANSAIDKVRVNRSAVVEMLAEYGDSDLLCYRATSPDALVARQAAHWDPILEWADHQFGARLTVAGGVMHVSQPAEALAALKRPIDEMDDFALAGFHDLVSLSGSLVLALSVTFHRLTAEDAWHLSRVDEDWQIEQWGEDEEATASELVKRAAFLNAARFFELSLT